MSRSVRQLLHGLVISDITQSVFARKSKEKPFLWIIDEAHNCFLTESLRDQMCDVLTMARSFGSFFYFSLKIFRPPSMTLACSTNYIQTSSGHFQCGVSLQIALSSNTHYP